MQSLIYIPLPLLSPFETAFYLILNPLAKSTFNPKQSWSFAALLKSAISLFLETIVLDQIVYSYQLILRFLYSWW